MNAPRSHASRLLAACALAGLVTACAAGQASPPAAPAEVAPAVPDAELQSYRAHLAAAEASLRLHDTLAARRWLDEAPTGPRGWEWHHVSARCDEAALVIDAHPGAVVFGLRVSADGRRLATASYDKTAALWDAQTGARLATFAGHTEGLWSAALSPDGTRVLTAAGDKTARVWDAATGESLGIAWEWKQVTSCSDITRDGRLYAVSSYQWLEKPKLEGLVRLVDAQTLQEVALLRGGVKPIAMIRFSPDGSKIAAACWDEAIHVWDVASGALLVEPSAKRGELYSAVDALAWSPDGTRLVAGAKNGSVFVFDATSGARLHELRGHEGYLGGVAWSPDGALLASGGEDATVRLWDAASGEPRAVLHGHLGFVRGMDFAPDGQRLWTASEDGTVRGWDVEAALAAGAGAFHHEAAYSIAFDREGRLVSSSYYDSIRTWDLGSRSLAAEFDAAQHVGASGEPCVDGSANVVACEPGGERIATGHVGGKVRLLDGAAGPVAWTDARAGLRGVSGIAFSPDAARVAAVHYDDVVRVFDAASGAELWRGPPSAGPLNSLGGLAFDPRGERLCVPYLGGARVLDAATGAVLLELAGEGQRTYGVDISPDGRLVLAAQSGGWVVCWEAETGARRWAVKGHIVNADRVHVSPDGTRAVSTANDLVVWDLPSGAPLLRLRPHPNGLYDARFTADGRRLVTLGTDNLIRVLDAP